MRATYGRGMSARSIALGSIAALAGLAAVNQQNALEAQRKYPPCGDFLRVRGIRLHKLDPGGAGPTVVLLHGNGATLADMEISGLVARAGLRRRVIAFDRREYHGRHCGPHFGSLPAVRAIA